MPLKVYLLNIKMKINRWEILAENNEKNCKITTVVNENNGGS